MPGSRKLTEEDLRSGPSADLAGEVIRRRSIGSFTLTENLFGAPVTLGDHTHHEAFITFVIEGTFREKYTNGSLVCRPGSVRFLPAGILHSDEIESELRCLHVSSPADVLHQ